MDNMNQPLPEKPNNHMVMAIISTVLSIISCTFFYIIPIGAGIASIVFATQVNSKYSKGDYDGAQKSSKFAKYSWIISIVSIVLIYVIGILFFADSWDEFMETFQREMEKQKELQGQ